MTTLSARKGDVIEIALVNNMPDQALSATQRQFEGLVRAAAEGQEIRLRHYFLPSMTRSDVAQRYLERTHEHIESLYRRGADAMIVTGSEPRAARLDDEPYWRDLQRLIDWARTHTLTTIWSCLAAHAAVLHLDGIERRRAAKKISGIFAFETTPEDLSEGTPRRTIIVPHSRYNELAREELESRGYRVASYSPRVGVDMFWREEPSHFLFLQGHPEYDADTLLREYRRDVLRFLAGERDEYPEQPANCFSVGASKCLEALRRKALNGCRSGAAQELKAILSSEKCEAKWSEDSAQLYREWLRLASRKIRSWRDSA